jgi:hypothetical protein
MGTKKKRSIGSVISVRVSNAEMATIRALMAATRESASTVIRTAIRDLVAQHPGQP